MAEEQPPHDFAAHPWLVGYEKKSDRDKMIAIVEQLKYLENLVGTISIILLTSIGIVAALLIFSLFTGKIDIGIFSMLGKLLHF